MIYLCEDCGGAGVEWSEVRHKSGCPVKGTAVDGFQKIVLARVGIKTRREAADLAWAAEIEGMERKATAAGKGRS